MGIVLLNQNNQIFVAKRIDNPNDFWQMPQGGIDIGENPLQAAYRELKEETQIELPNKADYLHETTNKTGSTLHIYFYKSAEALKPHINSEHIGWAYFSKNALPDNIDFGLNKYLSNKQ